jgi:tetratricopeptide (TPR) repeat protein
MNSALDAAFKRHVAGDRAAALPYYEAGLRHEPGNANAWSNLAELRAQLEQYPAAIACAEKAVALAPGDPNAAKNLGMILCRAEVYGEAEVWLDRAAALTPDGSWSIALDRALLYYRTGRIDESEAAFVEAMGHAPSDEIRSVLCTHMAYPVLSRAITRAAVGSPDWQRGLALYRHRFNEVARTQAWELGAPEWEGEDLEGKHILIHQDQGDGDTIQFCRFLPELGRRAGRLTLAVPRRLIDLLHELPWPSQVDHTLEILDFEGPLPIPDYHSPICTYFLHLDCTAPGQRVPYLSTSLWQRGDLEYFGVLRGDLSIGLVWAPRPTGEGARRRTIPLELLLPLARIPGVRLYSLQVGEAARDLERCGPDPMIIDLSTRLRDWADTAAYMEQLDLIVSIDSAPLHLAGAMNKRCIGLLPYSPCWRWGVGIEENCFYPTMTVLRQAKPGDWGGVMNRLRHAVVNLIQERGILRT